MKRLITFWTLVFVAFSLLVLKAHAGATYDFTPDTFYFQPPVVSSNPATMGYADGKWSTNQPFACAPAWTNAGNSFSVTNDGKIYPTINTNSGSSLSIVNTNTSAGVATVSGNMVAIGTNNVVPSNPTNVMSQLVSDGSNTYFRPYNIDYQNNMVAQWNWTTSFSYQGVVTQMWTVPLGCSVIQLKTWGGAGGGGNTGTGGNGGFTCSTITVTAGDIIGMLVAKGGYNATNLSAFAGGGRCPYYSGTGNSGGGGGATIVYINSPSNIVAISGGGGGGCYNGVSGGAAGPEIGAIGALGGGSTSAGGGSQVAGGVGGVGSGGAGFSGAFLSGGDANSWNSVNRSGGGGGSGKYGGGGGGMVGGGASGTGGGGGSSWAKYGYIIRGYNSGDADWLGGIGVGGVSAAGGDGRVVINYYLAP